MYVGHRYSFPTTLRWSQREFLLPAILATAVTGAHEGLGLTWIAIPWVPISMIGAAVAFYLGFKNNASYDRLWEARKIYGAIVNASRSWTFTARDFVSNQDTTEPATDSELDAIRTERIKNFPFPRQYATVNSLFAIVFTVLVPFGMVAEFAALGSSAVWLTVPFSTLVCWVFLTTDKIGDWSENPFEGLANDVPITSMTRGIERDIRQMVGQTELPAPRQAVNEFLT